MNRTTGCLAFFALMLLAQQKDQTFRTGAREVLVDAVVRDRAGKLVRGLTAADFELREDGVQQQILSVRETGGASVVPLPPYRGDSGSAAPAPRASAPPADPLRQLHLVALVFDRLGPDGRRLGRQAALDLLKTNSEPNTHFGVFVIQNSLAVLQNYTADREIVRKAVERATGGTKIEFGTAIAGGMRSVVVGAGTRDPTGNVSVNTVLSLGGGNAAVGALDGGELSSAQAARVLADVQSLTSTSDREQESRATMYSLLALVGDQRRAPGRKTLLYFAEGLQLPNTMWHVLESVVGAANSGNTAIYALDVRGLGVHRDSSAQQAMLAEAATANRGRLYSSTPGDAPVTRTESMATDTGLDALRANPQVAMSEIAERTGGFLATNTNDLRVPLRRAMQEMANYYEITYRPANDRYDGAFRKIEVRVKKPGWSIRARDGYFAFPPDAHDVLLPYEIPLLKAIAGRPLPSAMNYQAAALRFRPDPGGVQMALVVQTALKDITFTKQDNGRRFRTHLSALTMLKAQDGAVAARLARDLPLEIPAERFDEFHGGEFIVMQEARVPAGHYTLESALSDRESGRTGARRTALVVPSQPGGVRLSSLVLVRRVDESAQTELSDPFQVTGGRVVPWLTDTFERAPGKPLVVYFTIYPMDLPDAKPKLTIEVLADDVPVARVSPALPEPLEDGSIRYVASVAGDTLLPGLHEIRMTVEQAGTIARESLLVTIR
jgi:VWFA-related protein